MLPRQVENIGGSIGIFLAKYRSLIGKNIKNIGVIGGAFTQISHEMSVILSEIRSTTKITSTMFDRNTYVTVATPTYCRGGSRNFGFARGSRKYNLWPEACGWRCGGPPPEKIEMSDALK